ncbi:unnamed protein product [Caenorhabditis auriculariae]|uniref:Uncharacterized protein n=1 Tax=Caenorhabditis auriculariae TaxID=2777116 RepID=A0A8S1GWS3_9PELO|nr:unnamed protein product [Caenorhabditis auriculariae]
MRFRLRAQLIKTRFIRLAPSEGPRATSARNPNAISRHLYHIWTQRQDADPHQNTIEIASRHVTYETFMSTIAK